MVLDTKKRNATRKCPYAKEAKKVGTKFGNLNNFTNPSGRKKKVKKKDHIICSSCLGRGHY